MSDRRAVGLRLGAAGTCLVAGCVVIGVAAGATGKGRALLPNIDQAPPSDLRVRTVRTKRGRAYRLGFTSRIANDGNGPLIIRSTRPRGKAMRAKQVVALAGGGRRSGREIGSVRYIRGKGHQHWHVMGLQRFELRTVAGRTVRAGARKQGLCLGDREQAPGSNTPAVFKGSCGLGRPALRSLEQGLTPGWTDPYPPSVEGQEIDITRLRAGRYVLVHRADPGKRIAETKKSDNAASVAISVGRPPGQPPLVAILRTCPSRERCKPPPAN